MFGVLLVIVGCGVFVLFWIEIVLIYLFSR